LTKLQHKTETSFLMVVIVHNNGYVLDFSTIQAVTVECKWN